MFQTAAEIKECALRLIDNLRDLPDGVGDMWTQENFKRLDEFAKEEFGKLHKAGLKSFYRKHGVNNEFLWDFIAWAPETGIFIAAESEQSMANEVQVEALKHDFEKLLYVYSPIRIFITKAQSREHAQKLAEILAEYSHGCCQTFNPGSVFILHFGLWRNTNEVPYEGNVNYIWQSEGEPKPPVMETIRFEPLA